MEDKCHVLPKKIEAPGKTLAFCRGFVFLDIGKAGPEGAGLSYTLQLNTDDYFP